MSFLSMKKKKPTLADIKKNLDNPKENPKIQQINFSHQENPKRGGRGDFKRLSLTLPKYLLDALRKISLKRTMAELPNYELTSIVREALADFIEKEASNPQ